MAWFMISRFVSAVRGSGLPALPARVREDIARSQDRSEQIISSVQIAIVVIFGTLFLISPRPDASVTAFHLAPWALGAYLLFSAVRFAASCRMRLPG
jgi:adenylate cyclase